jgi:hypothetical protein
MPTMINNAPWKHVFLQELTALSTAGPWVVCNCGDKYYLMDVSPLRT